MIVYNVLFLISLNKVKEIVSLSPLTVAPLINSNILSLYKNDDITRNDFLSIQKNYDVDFDKCHMKINEFNKELKRIKYK